MLGLSQKLPKNLFGSTKKSRLFQTQTQYTPSSRDIGAKSGFLGSSRREITGISPLAFKSRRANQARNGGSRLPRYSEIDASSAETHSKQPDREEESEEESDWYYGNVLMETLNISSKNAEKEDSVRKLSIVQDLQGAFDKHGATLRTELAKPLVAALDHVSQVHAVVEGVVDVELRQGLITCYEASCTAHELRVKTRSHLNDTLHKSKTTFQNLLKKLTSAYERREALWTDVETSFEDCTEATLASLSSMEASIKRADAELDKQCRVLKHEADSKGKNGGVLKTLLNRL